MRALLLLFLAAPAAADTPWLEPQGFGTTAVEIKNLTISTETAIYSTMQKPMVMRCLNAAGDAYESCGGSNSVFSDPPILGDGSTGDHLRLDPYIEESLADLAVSTASQQIAIEGLENSKVNRAGDTMTGPLGISSIAFNLSEDGIHWQDGSVTTTAFSGAGSGGSDPTKVLKAGDTMTGPLIINSYASPQNIKMQRNGKQVFNGPVSISTSCSSTNIYIPESASDFVAWEDKGLIPDGAWMAPIAYGNGRIYITGSFEGNVYNRVYDIASDVWYSSTSYPSPLQGASSVFYDGKLYVFGGDGLSSVYAYDPSLETWSSKATMSYARIQAAACISGSKIYVIGGTPGEGFADSLVEEYDPALNTWTTKTPMPTPRFTLQCGTIDSKIYAVGGTDGGTQYNVNEEYDPVLDSWSTKAPMPTAAQDLAAAVVGPRLYAIDGSVQATQIYDSISDSWSSGETTPIQMQQLRGAVSVGDDIYVPNGYTDGKLWKLNSDFSFNPYGGNVGIDSKTPEHKLTVIGVMSSTGVVVSPAPEDGSWACWGTGHRLGYCTDSSNPCTCVVP